MKRPLRNDVMHEAFSNIQATSHGLIESILKSLVRNKPSKFGGWRVINRSGRNVKRRR